MESENAMKRIEKLNLNKTTRAYRLIKEAINAKRDYIRPCVTQGTGRHIHNVDDTQSICLILNKAGIKYSLTNDAPRGGLTGNIITLTHIVY